MGSLSGKCQIYRTNPNNVTNIKQFFFSLVVVFLFINVLSYCHLFGTTLALVTTALLLFSMNVISVIPGWPRVLKNFQHVLNTL